MRTQLQAITGVVCAAALAMTGLSASTALAAEGDDVTPHDVTIKVTDVEAGDEYEAYKLMNVTVTEQADGSYKYQYETDDATDLYKDLYEAVTGEEWGRDVTISTVDKAIYEYLAFVETNADDQFYDDLVAAVEKYEPDATGTAAEDTSSKTDYSVTLDVGDAGYYFLYQTKGSTPMQRLLIDVSTYAADGSLEPGIGEDGVVTVSPKNKDVTYALKIKDYETSAGTGSDWQDAGDYSKVNYATSADENTEFALKQTATLRSNLANASNYRLVFHTTLEDGLTPDTNSILVYIGDPEGTDGTFVQIDPNDVVLSTSGGIADADDTFAVGFANLLAAHVVSTSTSGEGTEGDGTEGTEGEGEEAEGDEAATTAMTVGEWLAKYAPTDDYPVITVLFNASLNENAVHGTDGNAVTGYAEFTADDGTIKATETDLVRAFTYQLEVYKVDSKDNPLEGAAFTLCQFVATVDHTAALTDDSACITDGAEATEGGTWQIVGDKPVSAAARTVPQVKVDENGDPVQKTDDDGLVTDEDGNPVYETEDVVDAYVASFTTLGDGTYRLIESTVPVKLDGTAFISMKPVDFEITATHDTLDDDPQLTLLNGTKLDPEIDLTAGLLAVTIQNWAEDEQLPSTGGMGTRLLYIAGGVAILIGLLGLAYSLRKNSVETSAK